MVYPSLMLASKKLVLWCLLVIAVATAALVSGLVAVQATGATSCGNRPVSIRAFTIIANIHGFNDSVYTVGNWPVLRVDRCDTVKITVINRDVQTHGLAVTTHAPNGIAVQAGSAQTLTFLANRKGDFRIYCNVFCTVHIFMQSGLLKVK